MYALNIIFSWQLIDSIFLSNEKRQKLVDSAMYSTFLPYLHFHLLSNFSKKAKINKVAVKRKADNEEKLALTSKTVYLHDDPVERYILDQVFCAINSISLTLFQTPDS